METAVLKRMNIGRAGENGRLALVFFWFLSKQVFFFSMLLPPVLQTSLPITRTCAISLLLRTH